jgi:hypothetical protein
VARVMAGVERMSVGTNLFTLVGFGTVRAGVM